MKGSPSSSAIAILRSDNEIVGFPLVLITTLIFVTTNVSRTIAPKNIKNFFFIFLKIYVKSEFIKVYLKMKV